MDASLVSIFDQLLVGADIPAPESMLKLSRREAARKLEDAPYSILTNLAHSVLWQNFWLRKLAGGRKRSNMTEWQADFAVPAPEEWEPLRQEFIEGLKLAREYAAGAPHKCANDDEARETLVRIAIHASYHCGQMNLFKRMSKTAAKRTAIT